MIKQLKEHETFIRQSLNSPINNIEWLNRYHKQQISYFQHERLVHLIVTLFFGLFLLISILSTIILSCIASLLVLDLLFLLLFIPYIFHYYRLENAVQRLYKLDKELELFYFVKNESTNVNALVEHKTLGGEWLYLLV